MSDNNDVIEPLRGKRNGIFWLPEHSGQEFQNSDFRYEAVAISEPLGLRLAKCRRIWVYLCLNDPNDLEIAHKEGNAAMRRYRIVRLARQAEKQGALLSQQDLAKILTTSATTIKRDIAILRKSGVAVPTRGNNRKNMEKESKEKN